MLKHTLKLIIRNLIRDKQFATLNILSLSLGIAAFFIAIQYASFEMSYDAFHKNKADIFRVSHLETDGNHTYKGAPSFFGIGPQATNEIPEILDFVRLHKADGMVLWENSKNDIVKYHENNAFYADQSFFNIFSFKLTKGSKENFLENPNTVFISESAAKKYFGSYNPIGETLTLSTEWKEGNYTVDGVFEDVPANSHLSFDFIFPITDLLTNFQFSGRDWYWINFYTYFKIEPNSDIEKLNSTLTQMVEKHISSTFQTSDYQFNIELQALTDINLHSTLQGEIKETGKWASIEAFLIAAFFTLALAWLNYINLTTAKATRRAKEIGLKKIMGSSRLAINIQFIIEAVLINLISIFIAIVSIIFLLPYFKELFGISPHFDWESQYSYWLLFIGFFIAGTLISSWFPAHYLSSLKVINSIKGQISDKVNSGILRKGMMMTQFALSLLLLIGSTVIYEQIGLMKDTDLGIDITNKLVIKAPRETEKGYWRSLKNYKQEILNHSMINNAAISFEVPGHPLSWGTSFDVKGGKESVIVSRTQFDHDFIPTYKIKLVAGKNFENRFEGIVVIINEAASKALGFEYPELAIGQKINDGWQERRIIGVIENYHQESPKVKVQPLAISPFNKEQGYITLSVDRQNYNSALSKAKETYANVFPNNAFEYFFLQDYFEEQYRSDRQFKNLLVTFTCSSIIISILGLIGFASFSSRSRIKEVGIRKVLGSTSFGILSLFYKEIGKLILLAFLLASPLIFWVAESWLENYANRINLSIIYFLVPMIGILTIAFSVISLQLIKLSKSNPVSLIRTE